MERPLERGARPHALHIETEHCETFAQLADRFDADELCEMGGRVLLARNKLTLLEEAKAA